MTTLLLTGLSNALTASLLAAIAYVVGRRCASPALAHSLWLLVLVKLVTPPIVPIPVAWIEIEVPSVPVATKQETPKQAPKVKPAAPKEIPSSSQTETAVASNIGVSDFGTRGLLDPKTGRPLPQVFEPFVEKPSIKKREPVSVADAIDEQADEVVPSVTATSRQPKSSSIQYPWQQYLLGIWLFGSLVCVAVAVKRIRRFQRLLMNSREPSQEILNEFSLIAKRMGLRQTPRLRMIPGAVTPMLWAVGPPTIYFPVELLQILDREQRATLFVHELAHVKRRDHWVRWLEMLAASLFWWLPVCRLACRELRRVEEECCDAWVIDTLPEFGTNYASALLDTIDFLAAADRPLPAPVCGIGRISFIQKRLHSIMRGAHHKRMSLSGRLAVVTIASVVLPVSLTLGQILVPVYAVDSQGLPTKTAVLGRPNEPEPLAFVDDPAIFFPQNDQNPVILSLALSPDREILAVGTENNVITLWDARTHTHLRSLEGHTDAVSGLAFSPDGKTLASASYDRTLRLWDIGTGSTTQTFTGHSKWVFAVAFSPDGSRIASASYDRTIRIWDQHSGDVKAELRGHTGGIRAIAFSPDGKRLVSGSADHTVRIWYLDEDRETVILRGHRGLVRSVAFHPDGKTIASGGEDRTVLFWDVPTLTQRSHWSFHDERIGSLTYSPQGTTLAVGLWSGTICLLEPETLTERSRFQSQNEAITTIAIGPRGHPIAAGGYDRAVFVWPSKKEPHFAPADMQRSSP